VTPPGAPAPADVDSGAPARADGIELLGPLSGSGYEQAPSLVRRADGQTVQLTPLLYGLLELLDGTRDAPALAAALSERIGKTAAPEDVEHLLESKLRPLGLLRGTDGGQPSVVKGNPLLALRFKMVVSDPASTRRLTSPFAWLFRPLVAIPLLALFAVTCWWVLVDKGLASATRSAFYDPKMLLFVFGLTVLSAGFHELGHAAACRYGGATPGAMGAGLYVVWPAFYTDVDDSYRLSRWGRLRVDLGGLYFNVVLAVGLAGVWLVTRQDALLLGIAAQLLQMLRQLAPYIRADGYHILADLTGVPDLFAHLKPTLQRLLPARWRTATGTPLKRWARVVVTAWVLVIVPVLLAMLLSGILLLPRIVATAWDSGGRQGHLLGQALGSGDVLGVLARLLSLLALTLPVAATTYLLVRVVRQAATRTWSATQGRPVARGGSALAGAALLGLLAWAWWPHAQYAPLRPDERGTVGSLVSQVSSAPTRQLMGASTLRRGTPRLALALVPRSGRGPALLLSPGAGGAPQAILTDGAGGDRAGQAFPFAVPSGRPGDNTAVALGTRDGATQYDVAYALVWVTDGGEVRQRNAAYALASCDGCTTVAVAFQVILVVGQSDVVVPQNLAVAGNAQCRDCVTTALAVQLVATLRSAPTEQVRQQIDAAWAELGDPADLDPAQVYAQVSSVQARIVQILVDNGLVAPGAATGTSTSAGPSPSASPTAGATPDPTGSATPSAGPTPSATSGASPTPSGSAGPSPTPSPTGTATPTASAAPSPG
jgi:putative peptide zinc metalloprotease protein